jgi:hypothetical protein
MKTRPATSVLLRPPKSSGYASTPKPCDAAGVEPTSKHSWETVRFGSGTSETSTSRTQSRSWTSIMPVSISGTSRPSCMRMMPLAKAMAHGGARQARQWAHRSLVTSLRALRPASTEVIDMVRTEAGYFEANAERMRYPKFRKQGLFVGTGVMEAGCKTVIGSRLKQSGMFWTVRGANAIIALRCCQLSGNFEDYWAARRA